MMLKSRSTTDIRTQTNSSYRQYGTLCTSITKEKRELQNHLTFPRDISTKEIRNKSPAGNVPQCHWWKYQNQYHKIWIILKEIKFYQKMIPKNPGIAKNDTQKSGSNPQKVPKIMAHPRITTYASYPPEVEYLNEIAHNSRDASFLSDEDFTLKLLLPQYSSLKIKILYLQISVKSLLKSWLDDLVSIY